jgi:Uma2 family endonuclease
MSAVLTPEQRAVLHNVSWETYGRILADHISSSAPHFTFDHGELEIMRPSAEHERYVRRLDNLIQIVADEMDLEVDGLGSNTFRREELERGFEPDCCYYVANARRVRGKNDLDLTVDPPPDLVVEVDITSPSIGKLPIFAEFGVPEVWRFRGERLAILTLLDEGDYREVPGSATFSGLASSDVSDLMVRGKDLDGTGWLRLARAWAHERFGRAADLTKEGSDPVKANQPDG